MVRFQRPAADLEQLGVAPQPLDDVLAHVAVAAENLDRRVGGALAGLGGEQLGRVGVDALARRGEVEAARRVVDEAARGAPLREALGDVALDLAVLGKKAILIPTPGQTEQEYLASFLSGKNIFVSQTQSDINLESGLDALDYTHALEPKMFDNRAYEPVLRTWVETAVGP